MTQSFSKLALLLFIGMLPAAAGCAEEPSPRAEPPSLSTAASTGRIASVFISEDMINELLKEHLKARMLQDVVIHLDPQNNQIVARGLLKIPTEDMKAINIEQGLGDFRFQLAIQLKTTRRGHLILIFPLDQTYFYPAGSKEPEKDRVVVPVQLLSLALASARGYLAVMSGDFSGFDKKTQQLQQQLSDIDRQLAAAKDPDERETLQIDRQSVEIQLEAIPLERQQGEKLAKQMANILGFVGEKEINLNQELSVHRNALIVKIQMGQLAPYLEGIELGGVRLLKDERDGSGENFLAVDINAQLDGIYPVDTTGHGSAHKTVQRPPSVVVRLNQALFESKAMVDAEREDMGQHIRNFSMDFKEDGLHANGDWHEPLLPQIPFHAIVDLDWTGPNMFEIRVRKVEVLRLDFKVLTKIVLEATRNRLDKMLKGAFTFEYVGEEKDRSRAIRVTTHMDTLLPAFPKLTLTGIVIKDKELLLKTGTP